ncbi:hypothetical protein GAYE_SCF31G4915 [Galdieria yellowstonensis]|uniref:Uncharacterized protein n=1 Tax=Galdieria yellowstonensis TaxID=3028027 RepID=A0AAV9II37_9RHOD|nr:hypothetical protein GAYE_SCF31G4915 [Galdieria yellowstonensis]
MWKATLHSAASSGFISSKNFYLRHHLNMLGTPCRSLYRSRKVVLWRRKLATRGLFAVLIPLTPAAIIRVIPAWYSWDQYNYFCWDPRALLDRATIASFGVFCVYLLVDLLGKSLAFRISLFFILWPFLAPAIHACLRNLNLRKYSYVALMTGRITSIYVARGNHLDLKYPSNNSKVTCLIYVTVEDDEGHKIQTRAWFRSIYSNIELYMDARLLVFSPSKQFHSVHFVSEIYIPQLGIFFGDYPALNRRQFLQLLNEEENSERKHFVR